MKVVEIIIIMIGLLSTVMTGKIMGYHNKYYKQQPETTYTKHIQKWR